MNRTSYKNLNLSTIRKWIDPSTGESRVWLEFRKANGDKVEVEVPEQEAVRLRGLLLNIENVLPVNAAILKERAAGTGVSAHTAPEDQWEFRNGGGSWLGRKGAMFIVAFTEQERAQLVQTIDRGYRVGLPMSAASFESLWATLAPAPRTIPLKRQRPRLKQRLV